MAYISGLGTSHLRPATGSALRASEWLAGKMLGRSTTGRLLAPTSKWEWGSQGDKGCRSALPSVSAAIMMRYMRTCTPRYLLTLHMALFVHLSADVPSVSQKPRHIGLTTRSRAESVVLEALRLTTRESTWPIFGQTRWSTIVD